MTNPVTRDRILEQLSSRCSAEPWILAGWEGGSAAFGREDDLSDIDWVVVTEPDRVEEAFGVVERALEELSPIEHRWRIPEPSWHGHAQIFYRLSAASPDHFVDCVVMRSDAKDFFLQPELHGHARKHFDRLGIDEPAPLASDAVERQNRGRVETIAARHRTFGCLADKELRRGKPIDALGFYQSITLRHLVELLRIRHDPCRPTFGLRYLRHDLPEEVVSRLEPLLFVAKGEDLGDKLAAAHAWIEELLPPV